MTQLLAFMATMATLAAVMNLVEFSAYHDTNEYYYSRQKNGLWGIFWIIVSVVLWNL